ncbi:MAG: hypothetical protein Ct9H300mP1_04430 [Planctomycetaceae bacterium]|nr:MAG: hypothetical protein Ct9H300mP1_04430 [Planctomycetaceae bacterium]
MLILGVVTYVQFDEGTKIRADLQAKTDEAGKEKSLSRQYLDEINELKAKVGYPSVASVGAATDTVVTRCLAIWSMTSRPWGGRNCSVIRMPRRFGR